MIICSIDFGGGKVMLGLDTTLTLDLLKPAMGGLSYSIIDKPCTPSILVSRRDDQWILKDKDNDVELETDDYAQIAHELSHRIMTHVATPLSSAYCLHAAAVSYQGKLVLLPGLSGSGKSSLTCWLLNNGFRYITDEFVVLNLDGSATGLARPIFIKNKGDSAIKPLLLKPESYIVGDYVTAYDPQAFGAQYDDSSDPKQIAMVLIPQYGSDSNFYFEKVGFAKRGLVLMGGNLNARNFEKLGIKGLMELTDVPTWSLSYSSCTEIPVGFSDRLKEMIDAY